VRPEFAIFFLVFRIGGNNMNKHLIASLCGLSLTLVPAVSNAYEPLPGPYFSFNAGLAMLRDKETNYR
jgi:hypothetical protein